MKLNNDLIKGDLSISNINVSGDITNKAFDLFQDTGGADWKTMLKNKLDYCISNMNTSKTNTMMLINGGWSGVTYGFGLFSKLNTVYHIVWFSDMCTYFCRKSGNSYNYYVIDGNQYVNNERVIGNWIDGKTLYRRTFTATGDSSSAQDITLLQNIDTVTHIETLVKNGDTTRNGNSVFYGDIGWASQVYYHGGHLTLECGNSFASYKNGATIYATIEYTKTTD